MSAYFLKQKKSWQVIADDIYLKPDHLTWSRGITDDQFETRFKYLLFPKKETTYIYGISSDVKISKLDRSILISQEEMSDEKSEYFNVILVNNTDGRVKRADLCSYISDDNIRNKLIKTHNDFLSKNQREIYWREVSCEYFKEDPGSITAKLKVLGKGDIHIFKYIIEEGSKDNYGLLPESSYVKLPKAFP
jgi:hypothetical protein